ncbi:MAG: hypothetical protein GX610_02505 [Rhodococcus sp.]|nr:hypothetical protein [Rhodococcus sp. (in: high G+C Gram-positive bacteria)]
MSRIVGGALVGGATLVGLAMGSGVANAEIEPGHYVGQAFIYGFIPTPESNINVIGNQFQQDYYGLGPQNLISQAITPTPDGGIASLGGDPVTQWFGRYEFHKTPTGYHGTMISWGIPYGTYVLTETPRLANQPG